MKPRDVAGDVVTTFVHLFRETEMGVRLIQQAVDKYLRLDLTERSIPICGSV